MSTKSNHGPVPPTANWTAPRWPGWWVVACAALTLNLFVALTVLTLSEVQPVDPWNLSSGEFTWPSDLVAGFPHWLKVMPNRGVWFLSSSTAYQNQPTYIMHWDPLNLGGALVIVAAGVLAPVMIGQRVIAWRRGWRPEQRVMRLTFLTSILLSLLIVWLQTSLPDNRLISFHGFSFSIDPEPFFWQQLSGWWALGSTAFFLTVATARTAARAPHWRAQWRYWRDRRAVLADGLWAETVQSGGAGSWDQPREAPQKGTR